MFDLYNFNEGEINVKAAPDVESMKLNLGINKIISFFSVCGYSKNDKLRKKYKKLVSGPHAHLDLNDEEKKELKMLGYNSVLRYMALKSGQLISPEEFCDVAELRGLTSKLCLHPHMWLAFLRMVDSYKKTSDSLVLIQCGASKPYINSVTKQWYLHGAYTPKPIYDAAFYSVFPIFAAPRDYTSIYPFIFYDAGHFVSESMECFEENTSKIPMLLYLCILKGYKKIYFVHNSRWWPLIEKITPYLNNIGVECVDVTSPEIFENIKNIHFNGRVGITKSRILNTILYKEHFLKTVGFQAPLDKNPTAAKELVNYRKTQNTKYGVLADIPTIGGEL